MKKVMCFVVTFLMVVSFMLPQTAKADQNTGLLNHYYTTEVSSNSATIGWNTREHHSYNTIRIEEIYNPSFFWENRVYSLDAAGQEYKFIISGLRPGTDYQVTISNGLGQHMVHLTLTTKSCQHLNHQNDTYVRTARYVNTGNISTHNRMDVYQHSCTDCRYFLGEFETAVAEAHNFVGDVCTKCSYVRQCSHSNYTDTISKVYGKDLDCNLHRVIEVHTKICSSCGMKLSEYEVLKPTASHNFIATDIKTHKCKDCGYVSNHVGDIGGCSKCSAPVYKPLKNGVSSLGWAKVYGLDALQLAKEGRLYITDKYGQLYKKTETDGGVFVDVCVNPELRYSSSSVYIAFGANNLLLYKNTSKGNTLTSINPELISLVDTRIRTFDTIIVGAQNAYWNGAITWSRQDQIVSDTTNLKNAFINAKKGKISSAFINEMSTKYVATYLSSGRIVEEIQQKLWDIGYTSETVTGKYLEQTINNICYFQIVNNLKVTGFVDADTLDKLNQVWYSM